MESQRQWTERDVAQRLLYQRLIATVKRYHFQILSNHLGKRLLIFFLRLKTHNNNMRKLHYQLSLACISLQSFFNRKDTLFGWERVSNLIGTQERAVEKLTKSLGSGFQLQTQSTLHKLLFFSYCKQHQEKYLAGIDSFQSAIQVKEKYLTNAESKFRMELLVMHATYRRESKLRSRCFKGWKRKLKKFSLVGRLRMKKKIDELEHRTTKVRYQIKRLEAKCRDNYTDLYKSIGCHLSVFMRSQDSHEHNLYGQSNRGYTR